MEASPLAAAPDARLDGPGDHQVDAPIVCVVTRFNLRGPRHLLLTYLDYRRVIKEAVRVQTPGLLRSSFLIENLTTCYSVSLWTNCDAIPRFGTNVPMHVAAAGRVFARVKFRPGRGPEVWSTKWRLTTVSNNLNWDDFDLRELLIHGASLDNNANGGKT